MSNSLSDVRPVVGPSACFPIGPDDATRSMLWRWHGAFGDVYRVQSEDNADASWVIHDPALVQKILVGHAANYRKGAGLDRVRILLGNGIMVSEGEFWTRQRRLLQPAFRPRTLADFNGMIDQENRRLAERWRMHAETGQPLEVAAQISESTLVIVLKSIFGADYPYIVEGESNPFSLLTEEPERNLRFAARFRRLGRLVEQLIDRRESAPRPAFDFLGHMLAARSRAGEAMSRKALIDEVMTLIVAGHETTASALAWAWYLIAVNPVIRERLQAAADRVDLDQLGRDGGHRNPDLAYFDAVINETLRLYPPGWLLSRRAVADDSLGEHRIEAGAQLFISPYVLHRHPDYWRAPETFDPARFEQGEEPAHRFAYIPFAAGPRHCIGEQMAMTEMRVHLVHMLRRFTPSYADPHPPQMESHINLRPADGIYLQLAAR
ncbi:cytochrome P450 [Salinisphaera sp. T31B1]|uniref:cytochrome P450 n=1 Tax=Salinisphaera sp. T31B1 TaxID=727963 RepID=UPI0033420860